MGFGGGGGQGVVGPHVHTGAAGQGGALDNTTLLNAQTLASQLAWGIIETYEAAIAESSHVFTFAAIDFDNFSELVLVLDAVATAAQNIQIRINTDATANYDTHGKRIFAGADTFVNQTNATSGILVSSNVLGANNNNSNSVIVITLAKGSTGADFPQWTAYTSGEAGELELLGGVLTIDSADISSIEVRGSANWKIGTRATLYRVAR